MADGLANYASGASAPAGRVVAVVKAENDLPQGTCRALLVGTAGSANLIDAEGNAAAGVPLQQGYNPLRCRRVASGGTAENIWALY
jgi:hypothetical protein